MKNRILNFRKKYLSTKKNIIIAIATGSVIVGGPTIGGLAALATRQSGSVVPPEDPNPPVNPDNPDRPGGDPDRPGGNPDTPGGDPDRPGGNPDTPENPRPPITPTGPNNPNNPGGGGEDEQNRIAAAAGGSVGGLLGAGLLSSLAFVVLRSVNNNRNRVGPAPDEPDGGSSNGTRRRERDATSAASQDDVPDGQKEGGSIKNLWMIPVTDPNAGKSVLDSYSANKVFSFLVPVNGQNKFYQFVLPVETYAKIFNGKDDSNNPDAINFRRFLAWAIANNQLENLSAYVSWEAWEEYKRNEANQDDKKSLISKKNDDGGSSTLSLSQIFVDAESDGSSIRFSRADSRSSNLPDYPDTYHLIYLMNDNSRTSKNSSDDFSGIKVWFPSNLITQDSPKVAAGMVLQKLITENGTVDPFIFLKNPQLTQQLAGFDLSDRNDVRNLGNLTDDFGEANRSYIQKFNQNVIDGLPNDTKEQLSQFLRKNNDSADGPDFRIRPGTFPLGSLPSFGSLANDNDLTSSNRSWLWADNSQLYFQIFSEDAPATDSRRSSMINRDQEQSSRNSLYVSIEEIQQQKRLQKQAADQINSFLKTVDSEEGGSSSDSRVRRLRDRLNASFNSRTSSSTFSQSEVPPPLPSREFDADSTGLRRRINQIEESTESSTSRLRNFGQTVVTSGSGWLRYVRNNLKPVLPKNPLAGKSFFSWISQNKWRVDPGDPGDEGNNSRRWFDDDGGGGGSSLRPRPR